ncbi:hypothetical protein [Saccharothrix sp. Mg75]|uniref:hypothetical protein n=1 Tax=Saccharothrix sp. Mg75 TaxID=3445357 RepID=UPI003EEE56AA
MVPGEPLDCSPGELHGLLDRRDRDEECLALLRELAGMGNPIGAMWALGAWLVRHDRVPEAVQWYALSAEHSLRGANLPVEKFGELDCLEEAERPLRVQAAKAGGVASIKPAELLGLLGRHDEADSVLRESLEHDEPHPLPGRTSAPPTMCHLVKASRRAGRTQDATQVQAYGSSPEVRSPSRGNCPHPAGTARSPCRPPGTRCRTRARVRLRPAFAPADERTPSSLIGGLVGAPRQGQRRVAW